MKKRPATIRVGIGGWLFERWRGTFYPPGLAQHRELEHASRQLSVIEINSTFYRTQSASTFSKWRDQTPDDFVFSLKASRYATTRKVLAEAGEAVERFVHSGIAELGAKLGPIVWEFAATKRFDPIDFAAFIALLPSRVDGIPLRHALDVRHESFACNEYVTLARKNRIATVFTDTGESASFADVTGEFVYVRNKRADGRWARGFRPQAFDTIATHARIWHQGGEPLDVPRIQRPTPSTAARDVFVLFIGGAKEKAPAAAIALQKRATPCKLGSDSI